jgi:DNA-binding transcriptional LysR family regulator
LSVAAPVLSGEELLRPILDAFLDAFPAVSARVHLRDNPTNLIDEGIDAALRIGHLPDSSMIAVRVGEVRQIIVASPAYLSEHPPIDEPADLAKQQIITMARFGPDSWSFPPVNGSAIPRSVHFTPRMVLDSVRAAVASVVEGHGVTRLFSYQIADHVRDGRLRIVLRPHEHAPFPVHVVIPEGRLSLPKVRAFADFAVARLRTKFARLAVDASV